MSTIKFLSRACRARNRMLGRFDKGVHLDDCHGRRWRAVPVLKRPVAAGALGSPSECRWLGCDRRSLIGHEPSLDPDIRFSTKPPVAYTTWTQALRRISACRSGSGARFAMTRSMKIPNCHRLVLRAPTGSRLRRPTLRPEPLPSSRGADEVAQVRMD
jgi:hypothetical protein